MMFKIYLIVAFIGAIAGGYSYHQVTVSKFEAGIAKLEANNRTLKENQVQLELAINTAEASLKAAEENAKKQGEAMNKLTLKNNQLQKDKDNAMRIFKDHNLTRLARARPGMIETRANKKTANVFRELENDTKELIDIDSTTPTDGVQPDAETGVGSGTDSGSTGTTDSNGN
jgi:chromosome segregation ATPase